MSIRPRIREARFEIHKESPVNAGEKMSSPPPLAISSTNSSSNTRESMDTSRQSNLSPTSSRKQSLENEELVCDFDKNVTYHQSPTSLRRHFVESEELVCDYDKNVTKLYELLESSNWEAVFERCQTHPIEVQTWVARYQQIPDKVRWKLLPLHSAVIFSAPVYVVAALFEQYPTASTQTDDQGMTPLNLAFRHHQDDDSVLSFLLEANPEVVVAKDYRGRPPIDHAMKQSNTRYTGKLVSQFCSERRLRRINTTAYNDEGTEATIVKRVKTIICSNYEEILEKAMGNLATALYADDHQLLKNHQSAFLRVGGPLAVVTKMAEHPDCKGLQYQGIRVLMVATYSDQDQATRSVVSEVDGTHAVMNAMERFQSSKDIQAVGLQALNNLACNHASNAQLMVLQLNVFHVISEAMKQFSDDAQVVLRGCQLLWNLASVQALREAMLKADIVSILATIAIDGHKDNHDIQKYARLVMKSIL